MKDRNRTKDRARERAERAAIEAEIDYESIVLPERPVSPYKQLAIRILAAFGVIIGTVMLVYFDRDGYADADGSMSLGDAIYYTTVTLSTTGYGDISPVSDQARAINAYIITPARVAFLVLLIGTTIEVLAVQGRERFRKARWRNAVDKTTVIIGYGTKGRSAVETLKNQDVDPESIVVIDPSPSAATQASKDGVALYSGDATSREVLRNAGVAAVTQIVITTDRDDSNMMATLNARALNKNARIVVTAREQVNVELMRQSGADSVITSSDAVGRLLGLSTTSGSLGQVLEDLLTSAEGLEVAEREILVSEVGQPPQSLPDQVVAVVRDEKVFNYYDPVVTLLARGDRLIVVRPAKEAPWAPRPGTHGELVDDEGEGEA